MDRTHDFWGKLGKQSIASINPNCSTSYWFRLEKNYYEQVQVKEIDYITVSTENQKGAIALDFVRW